MTAIFISYRRQDTKQIAGRIFDRLEAKFGADSTFMDIDRIPFGVDFHTYLDEAVARARIVLVLIGHGWAEAKDEAGRRRLDNPDDFVRIEVESALRRNIFMGALLIDGAPMPRAEQLPESMRPLLGRNASPVDAGRDFHVHMNRLIADLDGHLNGQVGPASAAASQAAVDPAAKTRPGSGKGFRDVAAPWCPEMVVVPAGSFQMGAAQAEIDRLCKEYPDGAVYFKREAPQHKVTIAKPFAVGRYAVTLGEFSAFVDETGYDPPDKLYNYGYSEKDLSFRNPGFPQDDSHPVVGVHWEDAKAYTKWLSGKTGKGYRPLSEAEWEYACRAGTQSPFWWGSSISTEQANYNRKYGFGGGNEGQYGTVPVKSFQPNSWGLYQVHGNVCEWCEEIYSDYKWWETYSDCNSGDGGTWRVGIGSSGTVRGGSWSDDPVRLRAACRIGSLILPTNRSGFRLARTL